MLASHRMIVQAINHLCTEAGENAISKGFRTATKKQNGGERIALIHSEASECLDALRHGNPPSEHIAEFSGAEEELADIIIRCADFAHENNWKLGEAVVAKLKFNAGRAHKHGGKKF